MIDLEAYNSGEEIMKRFFLNALKVLAVLALVVLCGCRIYENKWLYDQPKFRDVTIELGTTSVDVREFATGTARKDLCRITGDLARVNIGKVGSYTVKVSHAGKEEQVKLHVVDTTGAGDIFGGSAVWKLLQYQKAPEELCEAELRDIVTFACKAAGLSTTKPGGISSVPDLADILR